MATGGATDAERTFAQWQAAGIEWGSGANLDDLDQIERLHSVHLPASFRRLWSLSNGTATDDHHWLIFGQVSDMTQPLYNIRTDTGVLVIFADWKLGTPFALLLNPDDRGVVALGNTTEPVASSFDEFLALYLSLEQIWPR